MKSEITISELVEPSRMTEEQKVKYGNYKFNLKNYPETLSEELVTFLEERGKRTTVRSLTVDLTGFNTLGKVITQYYPNLKSFANVNQKELEQNIRKWLMRNGKQIKYTRKQKTKSKESVVLPPAIAFSRRLLEMYQPEDQTDLIILDKFEMVIKDNPTRPTQTLSLKKIPQKRIREEMKEIVPLRLMSVAVGTIQNDIQAINHFSIFLAEDFPEIDSLTLVTRDVITRYIRFLNNEESNRLDKRKMYEGVKAIIRVAARLFEKQELFKCFNPEDSFAHFDAIKEVLSDSELERIIIANEKMEDAQLKRYFKLLIFTGARSSNLLLLKQDCLSKMAKGTVLHIPKGKGKHDYDFPLDEFHEKIVQECIEYSRKENKSMKYVFGDGKDPTCPMKIGRIRDYFCKMIVDNDLRYDDGRILKPETHVFRRTLGTKLANSGEDDITIANLLGHSGTRALKAYRKVARKKMADDTREIRNTLDEIFTRNMEGVKRNDKM